MPRRDCEIGRGRPAMKFFSRLLGAGPKKVDGVLVLMELLETARSLKTGLETAPDFFSFLDGKDQALTEDGEAALIAGIFIAFGKDATAGAQRARNVLADLDSRRIDCTGLHEVEFFMLLMVVNAVLTAESIARAIDAAPEPIEAIRSMYSDETDVHYYQAAHVMEVGELASSMSLHRGMNDPEYESEFLESRVRPQIPDEIVTNGRAAWERCRS